MDDEEVACTLGAPKTSHRSSTTPFISSCLKRYIYRFIVPNENWSAEMPAKYNGQDFDTTLLATWAAFFDLAGWKWRYNISAIGAWKPDFEATFPCNHSECNGEHKILISVLPVESIKGLSGHPALTYSWGVDANNRRIGADAGAVFGDSPEVSEWTMAHGSGGGTEDVTQWVDGWYEKWVKSAKKIFDEN